jgi:hypothetical protein
MVQKIKDVLRVGPRTKIADRDMKVGDIVVIEDDRGERRLATVRGAHTIGGVWHVQLALPPVSMRASYYLPHHVKLRQIKAVYRKVR